MTVRVLFLGNTLVIKEMVKSALMPMGCDVITATSIALAFYLARKNFPELILCEATLSEGSGLDFLKEIRGDDELASIPFVLLAARPTDTMLRAEAVALGADQFISPVYGTNDIVPAVATYLHERDQIRPPETPE